MFIRLLSGLMVDFFVICASSPDHLALRLQETSNYYSHYCYMRDYDKVHTERVKYMPFTYLIKACLFNIHI